MRGAAAGDGIDITLEFRDQDAGADPGSPFLQTETQTFVLTTSWQQVEMTSTAPAIPPNPVYSGRVIFEAGSGDSVDIDDVRLPEPSQWMMLLPGMALLGGLHARRNARCRRGSR